jgi:hypothetical protein
MFADIYNHNHIFFKQVMDSIENNNLVDLKKLFKIYKPVKDAECFLKFDCFDFLCLQFGCERGNLNVVQWLCSYFNHTIYDITHVGCFHRNYSPFYKSIESGNLELVKWLTIYFKISKNAPLEHFLFDNLSYMIEHSNMSITIEILEWFRVTFDMKQEFKDLNAFLIPAFNNEKYDIVSYLFSTCDLEINEYDIALLFPIEKRKKLMELLQPFGVFTKPAQM